MLQELKTYIAENKPKVKQAVIAAIAFSPGMLLNIDKPVSVRGTYIFLATVLITVIVGLGFKKYRYLLFFAILPVAVFILKLFYGTLQF